MGDFYGATADYPYACCMAGTGAGACGFAVNGAGAYSTAHHIFRAYFPGGGDHRHAAYDAGDIKCDYLWGAVCIGLDNPGVAAGAGLRDWR